MTKKHQKRIYYSVLGVLIALIIIFACLSIWFATGKLTNAKISVLSKIPYPAALINGSPVMGKDFVFRYNLMANNSQNKTTGTPEELMQGALGRLVQEKKLQQVADAHDVYASKKQIDNEYNSRVAAAALDGINNTADYLQSRGFDEASFKAQVLEPIILTTNLQTWFFGQKDLNSQTYNLAESIQAKISSGEDMGTLASTYTQDSSGKLTGGDIGFVKISDLLPELQETLDSMSVGQVKIIPSRAGLNIVKLEEKDNNGPEGGERLHIRQIFLQGNDFNAWLNSQTKNLIVRQLIKI